MGKVTIRGKAAREKAVEILKSGGTFAEAASATGFCSDYVRQLGAQNGIRRSRCKCDHGSIYKLYDQGVALDEIAEAVGCNSSIIRVILIKAGKYVKQTRQFTVTANEMRICEECHSVFLCHPNSNKKFCSHKCQKAAACRRNDPIRRARKYNALVDADITLEEVAKRNNDICYLCGEKVDWSDYIFVNGKKCVKANYPSMEHVVALANGGLHEWNNIRLAHMKCNASKGVRDLA